MFQCPCVQLINMLMNTVHGEFDIKSQAVVAVVSFHTISVLAQLLLLAVEVHFVRLFNMSNCYL